MNRLNPAELQQLARKYRFAGGRLRGVRLAYRKGAATLTAKLVVRDSAGRPVRLALRLENVEEHRFQKRPNMRPGKVAEFRAAYLQGRVWVSFDSLGLAPGEQPGVHDFRASEAFASGDALLWEEIKPKTRC